MLSELDQIEQKALQALETSLDETSLEAWRIAHLGRSSPLMLVFDQLGKLAKDERPVIGRRANEVKRALEAAFSSRVEALRQSALLRSLQSERLDVTLPGICMIHSIPTCLMSPCARILRRGRSM